MSSVLLVGKLHPQTLDAVQDASAFVLDFDKFSEVIFSGAGDCAGHDEVEITSAESFKQDRGWRRHMCIKCNRMRLVNDCYSRTDAAEGEN